MADPADTTVESDDASLADDAGEAASPDPDELDPEQTEASPSPTGPVVAERAS